VRDAQGRYLEGFAWACMFDAVGDVDAPFSVPIDAPPAAAEGMKP
jgi:hypothetical protein